MRPLLLACIALVLAAPAAEALTAPGVVTFPVRGVGLIDTVDAAGLPAGVALDDGSVVLAGAAHGLLVAKLRADGSPDPAFGTEGVATLASPHPSSAFVAFADPAPVALLRRPDGRLVYVGARDNNLGDPGAAVLFGLTADGHPDPAFHGGTPLEIGPQATAAALSPDGSVLVAGVRFSPPDARATSTTTAEVRRVTPSGQIDPTYGVDGVATLPGEDITALLAQADGRGTFASYRDGGGAVQRLNATGGLDSAYSPALPARFAPAALVAVPGGVLVAARATVAGQAGETVEVVKLRDDDGSTDPAFGTVVTPATSFPSLAPTPAGGGLVVTGSFAAPYPQPPGGPVLPRLSRPDPSRVIVSRVSASGQLTSTTTPLPFGGGQATFYAIDRLPVLAAGPQTGFTGGAPLVRPDGTLLLSGAVAAVQYTGEGEGVLTEEAAVAALRPDGTLDPAFGGPVKPATASLQVPSGRARTAGDPHRRYVRLLLTASSPGLVRLVVSRRGTVLARSDAVVFVPGTTFVRALLTQAGRRLLRHAGRTPVQARATFTDFVGARATARASGVLR